MIGPEWTAIFPLGISGPVAFPDGEPAVLANGATRLAVSLLEPWDHQRRLRLELPVSHVVVGQRAIKWILPGHKGNWDVVSAGTGIRGVEPTIIGGPICIPGAFHVRNRVIAAGRLAAGENRGNNIHFLSAGG